MRDELAVLSADLYTSNHTEDPMACTDCGGTCDSTISSLTINISGLSLCADCDMAGSGGTSVTLSRKATCPNASWEGNGQVNSKSVLVYVQYDSNEDCYVLSMFCLQAPAPPDWQVKTHKIWQGCKGGTSPVGTYSRDSGCDTSSTWSVS